MCVCVGGGDRLDPLCRSAPIWVGASRKKQHASIHETNPMVYIFLKIFISCWPLMSGQRPQIGMWLFMNNFWTRNVKAIIWTPSCLHRKYFLASEIQYQILTSGSLTSRDAEVKWWSKKVSRQIHLCVLAGWTHWGHLHRSVSFI